MRLISPDLAHDLAAETASAGFPIGKDPLGSRHHGHSQTSLNAGQTIGFPIHAVTGTRNPAQTGDGRETAGPVSQNHREGGFLLI
jgi:hypothetical protein